MKHSCCCERFIYSPNGSANCAAGKYMDRSWKYINRSQIHECENWNCEATQFLFWEDTNQIFFAAVLRIHDILVWIRIPIGGSMPLTNGSCYFCH
jgi:hypothetical protein